jgi:hypothetical protein
MIWQSDVHRAAGPDRASVDESGISRRPITWAASAAAVSFAAALVIMAYGPELTEVRSAQADTFSSSALGHRAVVEFLEAGGIRVHVRRSRELIGSYRGDPIVVAEPRGGDENPDGGLRGLLGRAAERAAPVILVLPKWRGVTDPAGDGRWVVAVSLLPSREVQEVLDDVAPHLRVFRRFDPAAATPLACETSWGERAAVGLVGQQLLEGTSSGERIVWCEQGTLVARVDVAATSRPLYVVSDPDLISNHGLPRGDNAVVVSRFFSEFLHARAVVFDEVVHGYAQDRSFLAELLHYPLVVTIVHLLLVLSLVLWAGSIRFGKALPAPPRLPPGKQALMDNTAKLLTCGRRVRAGALRYFDETLRALARHYHLPRELTPPELVQRLGAIAGERNIEIDLSATRAAIEGLDDRRRSSGPRSVELATALHAWRQEMMHGR